ncbi:hypothetical protein J45TS6_28670 [Paenibacillus sp. J45TS6]|uniref:hypothetical protein n=1 Tax=unclassified Paenibacillus TaxID=185978 RepID=UPI001B055044|nr:hypothetical protein [Paenibacillus sp. J45TS6]GIP44408.1 hypothetical protein J45TS6_28670 [Paenibacillus sp. J45TS6]
MNKDRNWTVLFIGGASGSGKSSIAYEIARFYGVNVLEVDDVHLSVKTVTTKEHFPVVIIGILLKMGNMLELTGR